MRIAQIAPLDESIPPKLYGGTERVLSWLTEELVSLGHEVTLFASGDSETKAKLVACVPQGLRLAGISCHFASHAVMLARVRRQADQFILYFHVDLLQPSNLSAESINYMSSENPVCLLPAGIECCVLANRRVRRHREVSQ